MGHFLVYCKTSVSYHLNKTILALFNPLTTDDAIWRRLTLATCYQMAQSILKIGLALAKKVE